MAGNGREEEAYEQRLKTTRSEEERRMSKGVEGREGREEGEGGETVMPDCFETDPCA